MKKIIPLLLLAGLLASAGAHYWRLKHTDEIPLFFVREDTVWTLYALKNGEKVPTGLSVAHQENPYATGTGEDLFAAVSPDGQKVAFMQKPAWPHTLYAANVDGTDMKTLFTPELPAHEFIENSFFWSGDSRYLYFSTTSGDGGPFGGSETARLRRIDAQTGAMTEIIADTHEWQNENEFQPTKIMPAGRTLNRSGTF